MKMIQMTIDELLLAEVNRVTAALQINRSAFIRSALQLALHHYQIEQLEIKHAEGYAKHPVILGEFDLWESKQVWGTE